MTCQPPIYVLQATLVAAAAVSGVFTGLFLGIAGSVALLFGRPRPRGVVS